MRKLTVPIIGFAVGLCGVLALAERPAKEAPMGPMTREAAVKMVKAFLMAHKLDSPGLNDKDTGGVEIEGYPIYFEYQKERKVLKASALVYHFRQPPKPGVIDGFRREEQAGTDTGGGSVDYMPENRSLFLSRTYAQPVPDAQFVKDTQRLFRASRRWSDEVLERVANKVFSH